MFTILLKYKYITVTAMALKRILTQRRKFGKTIVSRAFGLPYSIDNIYLATKPWH